MASKTAEFDALSDVDDESQYTATESEVDEEEAKMKAKLAKIAKKKNETEDAMDSLDRNTQIEAKHQKAMIAFSTWLIAPFIPLIESLIIIFAGSIVMNIYNTSECTEPLEVYTAGNIFFAYVYVIAYGSVFIGMWTFKWTNMFSFKLVTCIYAGILSVWNIFGTAVFSNSDACILLTPELYNLAEWQVLMYWITLCIYVATFARMMYMKRFANQRARRAAQADRIRKLEEEDRRLKAKAAEEEEAKRKEEAEQEAEEEKRRLAKEAEDAKKRALAEQYGVDSDESDESDEDANQATMTSVPGTANEGSDDGDQ